MSQEIDKLLALLVDSFSDDWTEEVEELFTKLLEEKAGVHP